MRVNIVGVGHFIKPYEDYGLRLGDKVTLRKETDNGYDDEAVAVFKGNEQIGYVANSVSSKILGCLSAGRLYDRIEDDVEAEIELLHGKGVIVAKIVGEG